MKWSTGPCKNVLLFFNQNQKKSTIRPSNLIYRDWISTKSMRWVFYNQHINKVIPISLSCAGLKTQIPMHSNSIGCPKIFPLSAPVLYLSHLTRISSLSAKNERKTLIYKQLKISRYNQHFFAIFRPNLLNWPLTSDLFNAVWPHWRVNVSACPCRKCSRWLPTGKTSRSSLLNRPSWPHDDPIHRGIELNWTAATATATSTPGIRINTICFPMSFVVFTNTTVDTAATIIQL